MAVADGALGTECSQPKSSAMASVLAKPCIPVSEVRQQFVRILTSSSSLALISSFFLLLLSSFTFVTYTKRPHPSVNTPSSAMSQHPINSLDSLLDPSKLKHFRIENVPGFFSPADYSTDPSTYHYSNARGPSTVLGLLNRAYEIDGVDTLRLVQWQKFETWLNHTNANAPPNTVYKALYLGRHGEGEHNVAEAKYGTPMWDVCLRSCIPQGSIADICLGVLLEA